MRMKTVSGSLLILSVAASVTAAFAQDRASIEAKLTKEYALTQATADYTDIVTAGSILVLKKGGLVMGPSTQANVLQNTYKEGKVVPSFAAKVSKGPAFGRLPGMSTPGSGVTRTFVAGEKMWVTKIECKEDNVWVELFTDAFGDMRYRAVLKFPFDKKGPMPSAGDMSRTVGEVFKVQASDNAPSGGDQQQQQQAPPAPVTPTAAPMAAIAPPPPPPDAPATPPPTLAVGQTKDEVIAMMGQPVRIAKAAAKEFYFYKDVKVTFVAGKVTDIQ